MTNLVAGANQLASVPIKVVPSGLSCGAKVFLALDSAGAIIATQSAVMPFGSTGSQQTVAAPLIAPAAGSYYVFVPVYINGILAGVWSSPSVAVVAPTYANLSGQVLDAITGLPIVEVRVLLKEQYPGISGKQTYTNSAGVYLFQNVKPGWWTVIVSREGYRGDSVSFLWLYAGNNTYNFSLALSLF